MSVLVDDSNTSPAASAVNLTAGALRDREKRPEMAGLNLLDQVVVHLVGCPPIAAAELARDWHDRRNTGSVSSSLTKLGREGKYVSRSQEGGTYFYSLTDEGKAHAAALLTAAGFAPAEEEEEEAAPEVEAAPPVEATPEVSLALDAAIDATDRKRTERSPRWLDGSTATFHAAEVERLKDELLKLSETRAWESGELERVRRERDDARAKLQARVDRPDAPAWAIAFSETCPWLADAVSIDRYVAALMFEHARVIEDVATQFMKRAAGLRDQATKLAEAHAQ